MFRDVKTKCGAVHVDKCCQMNLSVHQTCASMVHSEMWAAASNQNRKKTEQDAARKSLVNDWIVSRKQKERCLLGSILGSGTHFLLLPSHFWLLCPGTWARWGCSYYPSSHAPPSLCSLFPKPVRHSWGPPVKRLWRGERWLLGGPLCTGSRGRRQCLINWLGVLGRVQEFGGGGGMRGTRVGVGAERWGTRLIQIDWPLRLIYVCLIYTSARKSKGQQCPTRTGLEIIYQRVDVINYNYIFIMSLCKRLLKQIAVF